MDIVFSYDSSVDNAPAGFKTGLSYTATLFDALFTNTATVTIDAGYGEINKIAVRSTDVAESLPNWDLTTVPAGVYGAGDGYSGYDLSSNYTAYYADAQMLALNIGSPPASPAGYIGFATTGIDYADLGGATSGTYDFIAAAEHEISEVLGRVNGWGWFSDLMSGQPYSAQFNSNDPLLSLLRGDLGDWSPFGTLATDVFAAFGTPGITPSMSQADINLMNQLGYSINAAIASDVVNQIAYGINGLGDSGYDIISLNAGTVTTTELSSTGSVLATQTGPTLPRISGTLPNQAVNDTASDHPFSGVTISDPASGAVETVTITLLAGGVASDANGTLSGIGLTRTGPGTYTLLAGSTSAVTAALQALTFTPTAHQVAPGGTVTTTMSLSVTDSILATPATDSTTTVIATAVNDAPAIGGTAAGQIVYVNTSDHPFGAVTITDPDVGASETVGITLLVGGAASDANGTLSGTGLTKTGTGTYTLTAGSPAAVTAALQALSFTPVASATSPPPCACRSPMASSPRRPPTAPPPWSPPRSRRW